MPTAEPLHLVVRLGWQQMLVLPIRTLRRLGVRRCYPRACMSRTPFDELVHRINNLLGTIELQAEVARGSDTVAAYAAAMASIVESARRTAAEVQQLRQQRGSVQ